MRVCPVRMPAARRSYFTAALAGAAAVLCRQTNAVWAAFVLGESVLAELGANGEAPPEDSDCDSCSDCSDTGTGPGSESETDGPAAAPALAEAPEARSAVAAGGGAAGGLAAPPAAAAPASLVEELQLVLERAWLLRWRLLRRLWPLLLPPAGFLAFLAANGGSVVLGDKEAHMPVRHGAQLLYFGGWAAAVLAPQLAREAGALRAAAARAPLAAAAVGAAAVAAAVGVAARSTLVHPYVLADNRWGQEGGG
ncbi:Dol-P-Glc:Glc(2)Man(9)GlcNAc(2)-PP-Dol alpha-1,2-glucosyltransferase [Tetrabaena socialis]|uniref:Dol-P-Glc:Glc(2)Man(9)GlcNAc(2)-PP-Dol alpha-1,2-glucosyltransferase n=1 Tax=Tetrabaena socialis TaxID=47790 RepID=A0A2J7ZHV8_9CHLO|nr:Dol-P-Glc:Glc(2)Man(9)GlcNAc(2)-PP-Dol alpha-1,2-glucosyltransferase [Tetrabaena socialis]|eukprot:PNG99847.1 Dol-P-Glc:Glc(2)Man(9)GlcNAc(2)-PP-Dol alpha-1,2-glucosyltransferase [Tetrabaena socialis]